MAILGLIGLICVIGLIVWPQFWIKRVMKLHAKDRPHSPGTGGELAQHLIEHFKIDGVKIERTENGIELSDHYDPSSRTVRLSSSNYDGTSLTAVAIAAHEVGHAMQHHDGLSGKNDGGLRFRQKLVGFAQITDKFASVFFVAAPVLAVFARTPAAFFGFAALGIGLLAVRILVHLVTLPVEFDASFRKALPILEEGGYLDREELPAARSVLKAAALTYVAGAIMSLIDLARWIRILR